MKNVYIYVVARDFGFAPNPFHGICSLATCKPNIRNTAQVDDWIIGVGGGALRATGKCIYAMKVTQKITFDEYWNNAEFRSKKPARNGSKKTLVGDNIYYKKDGLWQQAHSHHSNPDGTINEHNLERDTGSEFVLLSKNFYYFGSNAPVIPERILTDIGYKNKRNHRKYPYSQARGLVEWIEKNYSTSLNIVLANPFNFEISVAHYSAKTDKIILPS
ncbi:hypothetical protein [Chitinophaga varians]|uniref:Nmad2 family putative nucleotide modification protein n=1 Tax=Chitinophaga varians TaxID=2202339 RepID=UPI00165F6462|nr:hypothetical protein [Chitinophaga varians]MBC9911042.1 hypothetical protein [Chitinophaga varians]